MPRAKSTKEQTEETSLVSEVPVENSDTLAFTEASTQEIIVETIIKTSLPVFNPNNLPKDQLFPSISATSEELFAFNKYYHSLKY